MCVGLLATGIKQWPPTPLQNSGHFMSNAAATKWSAKQRFAINRKKDRLGPPADAWMLGPDGVAFLRRMFGSSFGRNSGLAPMRRASTSNAFVCPRRTFSRTPRADGHYTPGSRVM
jgi:hypothetical protein